MGGGGGGDDYSAKQAEIEKQKAASRAAVNALFGVAPTVTPATRPSSGLIGTADDIVGGQAPAIDTSLSDQATANKTARDAIYQQVRDNAFGAGKRSLDERRTTAQRQNKFALFAQGLNGGSEDIDQNALLGRTYDQGLLDLGAKADTARSDLRSSDESTRLNLLQSIDAGMDQGSAVSSALAQLKNNADRAASQAQGQSVGDLFGDAGLLYTQSQAAKGKAAARAAYPYLFSSSPRPAYSGGSGGIVTSTG